MAEDIRPAWTVADVFAVCLRHAVEPSDLDDMDQHDLFVILYEKLRKQRYPNAY
jgi:hypothetical protein